MNYTYSAFSNRGGRENNEDAVKTCIRGESAVFVVADGLGGHGFGEVASDIAVNAVCRAFEKAEISEEAARSCVLYANSSVIEKQNSEPKYKNMRSTVACAFVCGKDVYCANIGDTRIYLFHDGRARLISQDHSVAAITARAQSKSLDTRCDPDRNRLTRVLGNCEDTEPYINRIQVENGDALLLCTDGFWEYIPETEMEFDLIKSRNTSEWISYMLVRIFDRAPQNHDNLTAVSVMF